MGVIRILLAVSVLFEHIGGITTKLIDGQTAVLAFFIISGFYMNLILSEQYHSRKAFLINRALKLYPSYWFMLLLSAFFAYKANAPHILLHPGFTDEMSGGALLWYRITNFIIFGQDITSELSPRVFHNAYNHPVSPAWTLASELVFYVVIAMIPVKRTSRIGWIIGIILVSLWVRSNVWETNRYPISTIVFFMSGALSYYLYEYIKTQNLRRMHGIFSLGILSCCILMQLFKAYYPRFGINSPLQTFTFFTMICLLTPFIFNFTRHSKFDRFLGDLSYPIYIAHMVAIIYAINSPFLGLANGSTSIVLFTLFLAMLLHFLVEKPIERLRNKIKKNKLVMPLSATFTQENSLFLHER